MEEEVEQAYMKNKSEFMSIKEVEEGLLFVKKYFKDNFPDAIEIKYLKRLEAKAETKITQLYDIISNPELAKGRESELEYTANEMLHHYSCIKLIREIATVNNLKIITDLKFINKKNLREQAEKILKLESPESYQIYLKDKMEEKYGDICGSFYR